MASAGQISFSFVTLDIPNQDFTQLTGVNERGDVVGSYGSRNSSHGFMKASNSPPNQFTTIDVAGSSFTKALGINNVGDVVGRYLDKTLKAHGFMELTGQATALYDVPGSTETQMFGITRDGTIVGDTLLGGTRLGFRKLPNTDPARFNYGSSTTFTSVNQTGNLIVGSYTDAAGETHGFLARQPFNSPTTTIDVPLATSTQAFGVDGAVEIVGSYVDAAGKTHGFLRLGDNNFSTIDYPDATSTTAEGIARVGPARATIEIVGSYTDVNGNTHGFVATSIPEPSTIILAGIALVLLACGRWIAARSGNAGTRDDFHLA